MYRLFLLIILLVALAMPSAYASCASPDLNELLRNSGLVAFLRIKNVEKIQKPVSGDQQHYYTVTGDIDSGWGITTPTITFTNIVYTIPSNQVISPTPQTTPFVVGERYALWIRKNEDGYQASLGGCSVSQKSNNIESDKKYIDDLKSIGAFKDSIPPLTYIKKNPK